MKKKRITKARICKYTYVASRSRLQETEDDTLIQYTYAHWYGKIQAVYFILNINRDISCFLNSVISGRLNRHFEL